MSPIKALNPIVAVAGHSGLSLCSRRSALRTSHSSERHFACMKAYGFRRLVPSLNSAIGRIEEICCLQMEDLEFERSGGEE
jgi:hypothetical protein